MGFLWKEWVVICQIIFWSWQFKYLQITQLKIASNPFAKGFRDCDPEDWWVDKQFYSWHLIFSRIETLTLGVFQHEPATGGDGDGEDGEHEGGGAAFAGEFPIFRYVGVLISDKAFPRFHIWSDPVTGTLSITGSNPGAQPRLPAATGDRRETEERWFFFFSLSQIDFFSTKNKIWLFFLFHKNQYRHSRFLFTSQKFGALKMHHLWSVFSPVIFAAIGKQSLEVWAYMRSLQWLPSVKNRLGALCKQLCKQIGGWRTETNNQLSRVQRSETDINRNGVCGAPRNPLYWSPVCLLCATFVIATSVLDRPEITDGFRFCARLHLSCLASCRMIYLHKGGIHRFCNIEQKGEMGAYCCVRDMW